MVTLFVVVPQLLRVHLRKSEMIHVEQMKALDKGFAVSREDDRAHVSVRDTGVGIAVADRDRIFEEFRQAREGSSATAEGTGLGLSLTKALVELHHGRIWLESELGRGSTFNFTLPLTHSTGVA